VLERKKTNACVRFKSISGLVTKKQVQRGLCSEGLSGCCPGFVRGVKAKEAASDCSGFSLARRRREKKKGGREKEKERERKGDKR
jgi:hypothetical protein